MTFDKNDLVERLRHTFEDEAADRIEELEASLAEQVEWVRRLADDLIVAEAKLAKAVEVERERCAKVAESVALPMDGKIAKAQAGYMRGIIAHHIREGGK